MAETNVQTKPTAPVFAKGKRVGPGKTFLQDMRRDLCVQMGIGQRDARRMLSAVSMTIGLHLASGHTVTLENLGRFVFRRRKGRTVKPRSGLASRWKEDGKDRVFVRFLPTAFLKLAIRQLDPNKVCVHKPNQIHTLAHLNAYREAERARP